MAKNIHIELLDLWGSDKKISIALNVGWATIRTWRYRGFIPASAWKAFHAESNSRGIEVTYKELAAGQP